MAGLVVAIAIAALVAGAVLAGWGASHHVVPKAAGALCIVSGVMLATMQNVLRPGDTVSADARRDVERRLRARMRIAGLAGIVLGVAQFIPNMRVRATMAVLAGAISLAGVFRIPRRMFVSNT